MLTIVMYHYVRDLERTRYPRIKGLDAARFDGQLDYVLRHYTITTLRDALAAARGGRPLPAKACLLTFDDGFLDHWTTVFPRLVARGVPASFYPPGLPVVERRVLDVHKIHFILAAADEPRRLVDEIFTLVAPHRADHALPTDSELYARLAGSSRLDPPEIVFVKRALQRGLPATVRTAIVDELFHRHVAADETAFAGELYLDLAQLRSMAAHGMEIGGHGWGHLWLDTLDADGQRAELDATVGFLEQVHGRPVGDWTLAYPYGAYTTETLALARAAGCALGLTTQVGVVTDLSRPLELARLDTNDVPCDPDAPAPTGGRP